MTSSKNITAVSEITRSVSHNDILAFHIGSVRQPGKRTFIGFSDIATAVAEEGLMSPEVILSTLNYTNDGIALFGEGYDLREYSVVDGKWILSQPESLSKETAEAIEDFYSHITSAIVDALREKFGDTIADAFRGQIRKGQLWCIEGITATEEQYAEIEDFIFNDLLADDEWRDEVTDTVNSVDNNLGSAEFLDESGNGTELTQEMYHTGIGRCNIDNEYDTTYTLAADELGETECELLLENIDLQDVDCYNEKILSAIVESGYENLINNKINR